MTKQKKAKISKKGKKHENLAHLLHLKGTPFLLSFLIYFMFSLGALLFLVQSARTGEYKELMYVYFVMGLTWMAGFYYMLKKENLVEAVALIFLPLIASLGFIGIMQQQFSWTNMEAYLIICLIAYLTGSGMSYLMSILTKDSMLFIKPAILKSMILAMLFSLSNVAALAVRTYEQTEILDSSIGFLLAMIFFNLPFMLFYLKRHDYIKTLLYYLLPVCTYIILSILFVDAV